MAIFDKEKFGAECGLPRKVNFYVELHESFQLLVESL